LALLTSLASDGSCFSMEEQDLVQGFELFTLGTFDFKEIERQNGASKTRNYSE